MDNKMYFDEMNLLESEKEERLSLCNELENRINGCFRWLGEHPGMYIGMFSVLVSSIVQCLGDAGIVDKYSYKLNDEIEKIITEKAEYIVENTKEGIKKPYTLSENRSQAIARDLTNTFCNYNNHMTAKAIGMKYHKWNTMDDKYVRTSHKSANGQVKPIDEPFVVNGHMMMFPMDESLGAPYDELAGCRCTESYL